MKSKGQITPVKSTDGQTYSERQSLEIQKFGQMGQIFRYLDDPYNRCLKM